MKLVRVEPEVFADLAEASDWYEAQQPGLGTRFEHAMRKLFVMIGERPDSFRVEDGSVRSAFTEPFPYKVYYINLPAEVRIFAVLHGARDPRSWRSRS